MTKSGKSSGWYRERKDELHTFKDTTRITFYTNKLNMRKIFYIFSVAMLRNNLGFFPPLWADNKPDKLHWLLSRAM